MTCWVLRRKSGCGSWSGGGGQSLHSSLSRTALMVSWFRASCTLRVEHLCTQVGGGGEGGRLVSMAEDAR